MDYGNKKTVRVPVGISFVGTGKTRLCCSATILIFLFLVPSVTAQVSISPYKVVVAEGGDTVFNCLSPSSTETHEWLINGTSLNDDHRRDGVTQERDILLWFRNASTEYNNTRIQCRFGSDVSPTPSLLLVQGPPGAVRSLVAIDGVDNVTIRWTAPFTLDIPRVEPDISGYCVDVVSSTSSATLHSECGITETEFTYPLPPRSWCDEYNFTVMPVNVVGDGTTTSIVYSHELEGPELIEVISTSMNFTLRMSAPTCSAILTFEDTVSGNVTTLENTDLTILEFTITFFLQSLLLNRKYEMTVSAMNIRKNATSNNIEISTHDIKNCSLVKGDENVIIFVNFTEHSEATGAMLSFVYINDDNVTIDFIKSSCLTAEKSRVSRGLMLPLDLWYPGQYVLYVYDIESNREIMNGLQYQASDCDFIAESGQGTTPSQNHSCNISSASGMISVECSFSEGFQVTAQRNSMESVNILHVSSSMDPQTPVTLHVTENGEYLLAVLPIETERGILGGVAFSQVHEVTDVPTPMQGSTPTTPVSTLEPKTGLNVLGVAIPVAVVVMVLLVVVIVVVVIVVMVLYPFKFKKRKIAASLNPYVSQLPTASTCDEENAFATVTEFLPQIPCTSPIVNATQELQNTGQQDSQAAVNPHTTSEHENETSSIERAPFVHQHDVSEESPLPEKSLPESSVGDGPTPPHPTLESGEGQSKSLGSQYVVIALNSPTTKPAANEYATPGGYKNIHGQNYVFVDPKKTEVVHDGIELPYQESSIPKCQAEDRSFECGFAIKSIRAAVDEGLLRFQCVNSIG